RSLCQTHPEDREARELDRLIRELVPRVRALQRSTIDARLVPVERIFGRIGRMVARAARSAGKEVDFHTLGGETELDKAMTDELASPLVQLLRNALDHGIEPPGEREKAGKPRRGRLVLSAFQKGRSAVIDVIDDGRGISIEAVRAAAQKAGLVPAGCAITEAEARELIFSPGFSTAARVSQASGRGVGLDVVRRSIRRLKGSIVVRSLQGKGTTFTITLPTTLVLVQALIVRACGQRFAIPVSAVRESLRLESARLRRSGSEEIYDHPRGPLTLMRLASLMGPVEESSTAETKYAVVAGPPSRPVGIIVDGFLGQQEVVIKPIGQRLTDLPGLAGATDLGDATAVLVLDPDGLIAGGRRERPLP
ncbi:MAG TPA: chemotaxis protein CheW, partial [Candidatus Polarisedimenticolia bacterium]|nr:chemotaxis protein CheW [Candidatus Polarisedimenticolia bacterium]